MKIAAIFLVMFSLSTSAAVAADKDASFFETNEAVGLVYPDACMLESKISDRKIYAGPQGTIVYEGEHIVAIYPEKRIKIVAGPQLKPAEYESFLDLSTDAQNECKMLMAKRAEQK